MSDKAYVISCWIDYPDRPLYLIEDSDGFVYFSKDYNTSNVVTFPNLTTARIEMEFQFGRFASTHYVTLAVVCKDDMKKVFILQRSA